MRRILVIIPFLFFLSTAEAAYLDLAWDPNEEPDLAGYRIYYGISSGEYISFVDVGSVRTYCLDSLLEGVTYFIALTAYDGADNESDFSEEVSGVAFVDEPFPDGSDDVPGSSSGGGCFVFAVFKES